MLHQVCENWQDYPPLEELAISQRPLQRQVLGGLEAAIGVRGTALSSSGWVTAMNLDLPIILTKLLLLLWRDLLFA